MKRTDHVFIENTESGVYRMFCTHCGASLVIQPPVALDMAVAMMKQFQKGHRQCKLEEARDQVAPPCNSGAGIAVGVPEGGTDSN